jgi:lysophospholipase L1-like esterase
MCFLWTALGAVALGVVAELATRCWLRSRGGYFVLPPWSRADKGIDRSILPQLEERVRIEANRDGERGPEPPMRWEDTYRVLVAGGSAAECYLLDQDSEWPAVVRERLEQDPARLGAPAVHLGNISRSLVPCEAIDLILRKVLPRYPRLDMVALMIGASDVVAWLERGCPEELTEGEYTAARVFAEHPEGAYSWTPKGLALRQLAAGLHRRFSGSVDRRDAVGGMIAKNRAMRARGTITDEIADPSAMVAGFEKWLRQVVETARTKASRVLVIRQPWLRREFTPEQDARLWNFGAGKPYAEEVTTYFSHDVVDRLMGLVDEAAGRVADECGVEQLDLMGRLEHDFETFYDRLHLTKKGARVVGDAVADAILRPADR